MDGSEVVQNRLARVLLVDTSASQVIGQMPFCAGMVFSERMRSCTGSNVTGTTVL